MGPRVASVVDFVHALAMVLWVAGIPLLFVKRWERARTWYAAYALAFIALSKGSQWLLGGCFLTRLSTVLWQSGPVAAGDEPETWFTVRFAEAVFHLRPSEDAIVIAWDVALAASCVGFFVHVRRARDAAARRRGEESPPLPRAPGGAAPIDTR